MVKMLILGGDYRYVELMKAIACQEIRVYAVGYEEINDHLDKHDIILCQLDDVPLKEIDAILLPVSGTGHNGNIEATYSTHTINLTKDLVLKTPARCVIYTGISNPYLQDLCMDADRSLVPLFNRDDIAIYNSIPTAEGTLKIAIEETDTTIHGSKVLILGFGRVGLTIARTFSSIGAIVTVAARKTEHIARIEEMGLKAIVLSDIENTISSAQICINTIPSHILNKRVLQKVHPSALIIDIASKPGGTDFSFAKEKGINAIHALGIPGKTAPKTAGKIIAKVLLQLLNQQFPHLN
ncbi:dipicolinate synthase subunit DpsA [Oceanobacillus piezotolerans]|uniref:Dipicolinate synthase subunit DpsA n=1 Tax=Oceanobacillus piezotolerans TaxID=2448030 RepID=A0A498D8H3_9BACI|nr:dipicolinate synthase subunit DpsA [Oceanobacillus piezotolerans]RLL45137.1 dipicolinate synthase subunit DpsA [Oceanobacillus piezotolerans]